MSRVRPWLRTIVLLVATFGVYVAVAVLVGTVSGDPILGSAVAAVVMGAAALAYRYWNTRSILAPELPQTAVARTPKFWAYAALGLLLSWVSGQTASVWIYQRWGDAAFDAHNAGRADSPILLVLVTSLLLAPMGEEAMMRGIAYPEVRRHWPIWPSAFVTAAVFAILHTNPTQVAVAFPLGFLLAFVYEATQRLWPVVLMHAIFNFASMFVKREVVESFASLPVVIIALIALLITITALRVEPSEADDTEMRNIAG